MKMTEEVVHSVVRQGISIICALLLVLLPFGVPAFAQDSGPAQPTAPQPPAQLLTPDQLDNLVAPVALYPDALLSQVLVASTYPLEIVEASQWLQQNGNLRGQQLVDAARQQNWDPSIQALVAFPDVLGRLGSNIAWTSDLGNAFLAQQSDVMNAVQRMRAQAQAAGKLNSDSQQTVVTQTQGGRTVIEIAPADPQVIYVPQYNPEYIWGPPDWGYYPSLYYPSVGFGFSAGIFLGSYFGGWTGWGPGGWGGWGWGPNWFNCTVVQNSFFFNHYRFRKYYGGYGGGFGRGGIWAHNPYHRLGVPYPNRGLANRFGGNYIGRGGVVRSGLGGQRGGAFGRGRFQGNVQSFGPRGTSAAGGWRRFGSTGANVGQRGGAFGGSRLQSPQVRRNARSFGSQAGRASPGSGGQWSRSNGFNSAAANHGRDFRSTPSYGRNAPSFRQSPSFGGISRSASSFGGGRSFGGSRPSFQGGGRSFGGSRPSFGGGGGARSFGGGHSGGGSHGGGHGGRR